MLSHVWASHTPTELPTEVLHAQTCCSLQVLMGTPDIHLRALNVRVLNCIGMVFTHPQSCRKLKPTWDAPSRPVSRLYSLGTASFGPGCSRCAENLDMTESVTAALLAGRCAPSRSTDPLPQLGGPDRKASSLAPGAAICSVSGAGSGPLVVPLARRKHSRDRLTEQL